MNKTGIRAQSWYSRPLKFYDENPDYWNERIRKTKTINDRQGEIAIKYLAGSTSYSAVGRDYGISPDRVRQIVVKILIYVRRVVTKEGEHIMVNTKNIQTKPNPEEEQELDPIPMPEKTHNSTGMMGKTLTKEEFDKIKELQFRGEPGTEITKAVKRSSSTVNRAMQADTYPEYFGKGRGEWESKKPMKSAKEYIVDEIKGTYQNLQQFRERFDEVLIDFIIQEVGRKYHELVAENAKLKTEIKKLQAKVEQLEKPDFTKKLQEKLNEVDENH
jgi:hypothetical protein